MTEEINTSIEVGGGGQQKKKVTRGIDFADGVDYCGQWKKVLSLWVHIYFLKSENG